MFRARARFLDFLVQNIGHFTTPGHRLLAVHSAGPRRSTVHWHGTSLPTLPSLQGGGVQCSCCCTAACHRQIYRSRQTAGVLRRGLRAHDRAALISPNRDAGKTKTSLWLIKVERRSRDRDRDLPLPVSIGSGRSP